MKIVIIFLFILCHIFLLAQNISSQANEPCGADERYKYLMKHNPAFSKRRDEIEKQIVVFIKEKSMALKIKEPLITIPVVFHIVYNVDKSEQKINSDLLRSQIDVLNEDFQKRNVDVIKVPPIWTSLVADCQIQFCLATIDPNDKVTTGMIYKPTSVKGFSDLKNNVKRNEKGGDDPWPSDKYLNIWVCDIKNNEVLGSATFPGETEEFDGVMIDYLQIGRNNIYPLGRTCTHEVGHWLGLYHLWGIIGLCIGSDEVDDTPKQYGANEDICPKFPHVSCSDPNGDMFMNYMDYTPDDCRHFFTIGQKDWMRAILQPGGARYSVTVSGKCNTPSISKLSAYEYWFDEDYANKVSSNIDNVDIYNLNTRVPMSGLTQGIHSYHIRFKDDGNKWSSVVSQFVFSTPASVGQVKIDRYEYWFDNNYSQKVSVNLSQPANIYTINTSISTTGISDGKHGFHIRFRQNNALWSSVVSQNFKKTSTDAITISNSKEAITEFNIDNNIFVYPNPANGQFSINVDETVIVKTISIINSAGKNVFLRSFSEENETGIYNIQLSNVTSGTYYVKVFDGVKNYTQKVVIEK